MSPQEESSAVPSHTEDRALNSGRKPSQQPCPSQQGPR